MGLSNGRSCLGYPWEWHLGGEARGDINMWGKGNERKCLCLVSNGSWMDCNQRLLPIYQPNSTLSGAIWKRDVLHTFLMEVRDWVALDCCGAGGDHFRFMLLDGWHGGWQTRYKKYFLKYKVQKKKKEIWAEFRSERNQNEGIYSDDTSLPVELLDELYRILRFDEDFPTSKDFATISTEVFAVFIWYL